MTPTLPTAVNPNQLPVYTTQNLQVPKEGPRAIPLLLDFSLSESYSLNLQNSQELLRVTTIQGVFIDNSQSSANVAVSCPVTGQVIIVAPGHQAYKTLFCPYPSQINFYSTGGIVLKFQLTNFPVVNDDWSTT
jgi:hypothetical protein